MLKYVRYSLLCSILPAAEWAHSSNRFELLASPAPLAGFERLRSLQLNNTLISWREVSLFMIES